jgi:homoserine kinase
MPLDADRLRRLEGRRIVVPGSTSNLGPGFDTLGLALQIYLHVRVTKAADEGRNERRFTFVGGAPEGANAIARALDAAAEATGLPLPSLDLEVANDIPIKAGLGSSAAAIVAGLRVFAACHDLDDRALLRLAGGLEGHPDNVSASLFGGLTASCQTGDDILCVATPWPDEIRVVVATPHIGLSTQAARAVLPASVSRTDAIFNVQRVALMLQALATREYGLVREALADRLHQPYRTDLVPGLAEAAAFRHESLLGTFLSGAGPSVAALVVGEASAVESKFHQLYDRDLGLPCRVRTLAAHQPAPDPPRTIGTGPVFLGPAPVG